MVRIAVLVSGSGTNLQAIIEAIANDEIENAEIRLVVSDRRDAYALDRALNNGIDTLFLSKKEYSSDVEFCQALEKKMEQFDIDLIVLAGFLSILSDDFVQRYEGRIMNIHPSLLPAFGGSGFWGLRVHKAALEAGVKVTGASVHFVTSDIDAGPIILQKAIEVPPGISEKELQKLVMNKCEWLILPRAIDLFCNNRIDLKDKLVTIK